MPVSIFRTWKSFGVEALSLKSKVSRWLIAPEISKKITFRAFPRGWVFAPVSAARSFNGQTPSSEAPKRPSPPYFNNSRRVGIRSPTVLGRLIVGLLLSEIIKKLDQVQQRPLDVLSAIHAILIEERDRQRLLLRR